MLFEADDLGALDARERNYERVEVRGRPPHGRAWAYIGTPDARERFEKGRAAGTAVVDRAYYESVPSAEPPPVPIRKLKRIDL